MEQQICHGHVCAQSKVDECACICPSDGAINGCTCCADALSIVAGSAPNVTCVTVTGSTERRGGADQRPLSSGPPVTASRPTRIMFKINLGALGFSSRMYAS